MSLYDQVSTQKKSFILSLILYSIMTFPFKNTAKITVADLEIIYPLSTLAADFANV